MLTLLMFPDFTSSLASWNAKKPAETPGRDDPGRHIVAKMITVQLLASCFTSPQNINTLSLQSGRYHRQHHTNDKGQELRLVSSLRQHTQWRYSPAHGHHARSNSAVSLWPDQDGGLAREDSLAEQVSRKRFLREKERRAMRKGIIAQLRSQGESSDDESRRHHFLPLRHRGPRKTKRTPFSQRFLPGRYGPSPVPQTSEDQVRQINILRVLRGLRQRDTGDDGHRWSLEPVSKRHPVFVQPVKEYMMQRWGIFRSRTFGESSTSAVGEDGDEDPAEQCRVGTSRESIQLSRQDQVMTLIQGSGSSLGMPSHNTKLGASVGPQESTNSAPGNVGDLLTLGESLPPLTPNTVTSSSAMHQCSASSSPTYENMEETPYFPPVVHPSVEPPETLEVGPTRNRSGTTVHTPSSIAEAAINMKKLNGNGSASSGAMFL